MRRITDGKHNLKTCFYKIQIDIVFYYHSTTHILHILQKCDRAALHRGPPSDPLQAAGPLPPPCSAYLSSGSLPLLPQPRTSSASDPEQTVRGSPHSEPRTADRNHQSSQHLATRGPLHYLHTDTPHGKHFRCVTKTIWTPEFMRSLA